MACSSHSRASRYRLASTRLTAYPSRAIELRGLDDRLRVEVLATNWRLSDLRASPRVRLGGSAQWRSFYVQAGVLDALDDPRASAYVGVGLRWRDPDLLAAVWWLRH